MKIAIILSGEGGELDRHVIEIKPGQDENAVIGNSTISAIEGWTLSPGDTIQILAID